MSTGLIFGGESALWKDGDFMRKRKNPGKKQRRIDLAQIRTFATALYWLTRLILLFWDKLSH